MKRVVKWLLTLQKLLVLITFFNCQVDVTSQCLYYQADACRHVTVVKLMVLLPHCLQETQQGYARDQIKLAVYFVVVSRTALDVKFEQDIRYGWQSR